jgi:hypothetical protein
VLSLVCFSPILIAVALEPVTGVRWWRAIPLGAVERLLASAEVATVLAMAWWAYRACGDRARRSWPPFGGPPVDSGTGPGRVAPSPE